jgi:hypothetical protein
VYQLFHIFISILCMFSSYFYIFLAANRAQEQHEWDLLVRPYVVTMEGIFSFYMALQFFKEFQPDYQELPERDFYKIGKHYFETDFFSDFLPLIPF